MPVLKKIIKDSIMEPYVFGDMVFEHYDLHPDRTFKEFEYIDSRGVLEDEDKRNKETDSFPIRKHTGAIHYVPIPGEMIVSIEPLITFYLAEMAGFKVVAYGTKNMFPLLSLISHECVVVDSHEYNVVDGATLASGFPGHLFPHSRFESTGHEPETNPLGMTWEHTVCNFSSLWFWYRGNLVGERVYPYNELLRQVQYYPTTDDLVDFYKDSWVSILESSFEDCKEIEKCEFFDNSKKFWFEHKMNENEIPWDAGLPEMEEWQIEISGRENVLLNTLGSNQKKLQKYIMNKYPNSFLSFQLYCSMYLGVRFNCWLGSSTLMSMIPHLNCHLIGHGDRIYQWIREFKEKVNWELFGDMCFGYHETYNLDEYRNAYEEWRTTTPVMYYFDDLMRVNERKEIPLRTIDDWYNYKLTKYSDMQKYLPILKKYAELCDHVIELGVRDVVSTWGLLAGNPKKMISVDVVRSHWVDIAEDLASKAEIDFTFIGASSLDVELEDTDLMFFDTWHTYDQLSQELKLHGSKVKKYLLFHDTGAHEGSCGLIGDDKKRPGLRKAIEEFLEENKEWKVELDLKEDEGFMVLGKTSLSDLDRNLLAQWS